MRGYTRNIKTVPILVFSVIIVYVSLGSALLHSDYY